MYHYFLIHPSAYGHLGCFLVLVIVNSAAMSIGVHVSLSILVSSVCLTSSEIAKTGHGTAIWLSNPAAGHTHPGNQNWKKHMFPNVPCSTIHSSILTWRIPWTKEPGRLQSMGSLRVGHDWATSLWLFTFMHWRRKWQPTPVFLPGESPGRGSLVGCCLWGRTESDTTEVT